MNGRYPKELYAARRRLIANVARGYVQRGQCIQAETVLTEYNAPKKSDTSLSARKM